MLSKFDKLFDYDFVMCVSKMIKKIKNQKFAEIPELELISLAPTPNTPHTNQSITNTTSTPANNSTQQQATTAAAASFQSQHHHNPPQMLIPMQTQSTNSGTPRAVSPEPTSSSTSMKSNFRSWFSTNIPAATSGNKQLNNTSSNVTANNSLSGGNSMFDSNSSSTLSNIHQNDGVTTNGNSQQQADIQGSYISPALSQLSEQNSSALSSSNAPSTTLFFLSLISIIISSILFCAFRSPVFFFI